MNHLQNIEPPPEYPDWVARVLQGKSGILAVDDKELPNKKRNKNPMLIVTPLTIGNDKHIVLSYINYGSTLVPIDKPVSFNSLVLLGLSPRASTMLQLNLDRLFRLMNEG